MELALRRELGDLVTWPEPKGGFFLWASFPAPLDTGALLARAVEQGVVYVPGSAFFVAEQSARFARLSFSWPAPERIDTGITRLARVVRGALEASGSPARVSSGEPPGSAAARSAR